MKFDVEQIKASVNLIEYASRYSELRRASNAEYYGPCPWCQGTDRFRVFTDHFFCRPGPGHCGRKGDVIEFVAQQNNTDFKGACELLSGGTTPETTEPLKPVINLASYRQNEWDAARNTEKLLQAHEQLLNSAARGAVQCRDYLTSRGIATETIKAFKLGYRGVNLPSSNQKELAIAIPWFDQGGALVAIKYRFTESYTYTDIENKEQTHNKTSRGNFKGHLFGWQAVTGLHDTLVVIEGEINALSLWQTGRFDVLSVGGQSMFLHLPEELIETAKKYKKVLVWADELPFAEAAAGQLGAIAMNSEKDANKLLIDGELDTVLDAALVEPEQHNSWPYTIKNGCLVHQHEKQLKEGSEIVDTEICTFTAVITNEIIKEDGKRIFVISGKGKRGGDYSLEIDAEEFGNTPKLCAALGAAVGSMDTIHADQSKHMGPAIKLLTQDIKPKRRYTRTGWTPYGFALPGKTIKDIDIELPHKLAFRYDPTADLQTALDALPRLIEALDAGNACIVLSALLSAPLSHVAGWDNDRYAVFIRGRSNSLKTSFAQAIMSIYGDFMNDNDLIKMGEGATKTALMSYATCAQDMPLLIDNYKPNTGGGGRDFYGLLHNILEGGDKDRGMRDGTLRENKPVSCWPVFTGEDVPDSDASSFARMLVVSFEWGRPEFNDNLGYAQERAEHLPAIGRTWLDWLEAGQVEINKARFTELRKWWIDYLSKQNKEARIILRIATSLAVNEMAFEIALQHPVLGDVLAKYQNEHKIALQHISSVMAQSTVESAEYQRYLGALRELIITKRALLASRSDSDISHQISMDPERFIGWVDDEGIYLLPTVARKLVMSVLEKDGLGGMSNAAIYNQMLEAGVIFPGPDQTTKKISVGGNKYRVLHLKSFALGSQEDEPEMSIIEELGL